MWSGYQSTLKVWKPPEKLPLGSVSVPEGE